MSDTETAAAEPMLDSTEVAKPIEEDSSSIENDPPTTTLDTAAAESVALAWGSVDDELATGVASSVRHPWSRAVVMAGAMVGTAAVAATVAAVVLWPDHGPMAGQREVQPTPSTTAQNFPPHAMDRVAQAGKGLCRRLATGENTRTSAIASILSTPANDDMTVDQVTYFIDTAIAYYCPQYK
jgi:hypothetical protein